MVAERVGPELPSGDPEWIEPTLADGGAHEGDIFICRGRWKDRIYPDGEHLADRNPLTVGHVGLRSAMERMKTALYPPRGDDAAEADTPDDSPNADLTVRAMVAVYDALEWIHSLDEHCKRDDRYAQPTEIDTVAGEFVLGAIGARNASHHGLRRVVGRAEIDWPTYICTGTRWVHSAEYRGHKGIDVRWVEHLPPRIEANEAGRPVLDHPQQSAAFEAHLAGRDVYRTLMVVWTFFRFSVIGGERPEFAWGPSQIVPNIDPNSPTRAL